LGIGLSVEVDVRVRMSVPDQEFLDAQRTGAVGGTNKDHIAVAAGNQLHAPEDERPHEDFAQLGVGLHERQELFAIQFDHFAGFADPRSRQRGPAGDQVRLARKLARTERRDDRLGAIGNPYDLYATRQDHEERDRTCAGLDEHLARSGRSASSVCGHARNLGGRQRREQPFQTRRVKA